MSELCVDFVCERVCIVWIVCVDCVCGLCVDCARLCVCVCVRVCVSRGSCSTVVLWVGLSVCVCACVQNTTDLGCQTAAKNRVSV